MEAFLEEIHHLKIQLAQIKSATSNFDKSNIIGKGGFGMVYKGVVSHSKGKSMAAVKRLDRRYGQGDSEFYKEILMLSRYTHENLISLVGFCDEEDEKILVYEHAYHGSLDRHLSSSFLSWRQRLKICLDVATGLCYLHDPNGTQQRVIHRDVKSSNILLDENWNGKVSDMGLSKFGPANQPHTFLATNVVGTYYYTDPMYMETHILTKESDVYSFGVVLFEVLCGRLCFEYGNGPCKSLVPMWKKHYKEHKLDEIIFQDMKQHMDQRSLETFSDIAYHCLQKSREKRPKMSDIVEKLEIALRFREDFEQGEPPMDYEEISKNAVHPLVYRSMDELKMLLSKGILVNGGNTWFFLNNKGEHCELISASECLIPMYSSWRLALSFLTATTVPVKSRFARSLYRAKHSRFKIHVRTQFLSPHITYTVNLVFLWQNKVMLHKNKDYVDSYYSFSINYTLAGENRSSTLYFVDQREDQFLIDELYQFTSNNRKEELEITFQSTHGLVVEGIEFQPAERVENGGSEDKEVDIQTMSHPDTYWEQKLPNIDYEEIIKWSKDSLQWTTKKELYSILCKGFLINNGEEWFSITKNGKICHMLSARLAFRKSEWSWISSSESRFEEVAFDPHGSFYIDCSSNMQSPETKYGSYLVYKIQETYPGYELAVKVSYNSFVGKAFKHPWLIYLLSPKTPVIRPKVYQNTHNPLNRPKRKGLPQQRNDGWMEVQIREFKTGTTMKKISENLVLTFFSMKLPQGLIVKGIEFKPV